MKEKIDVVCMGILVADIPCSSIEKVPEPGELASTEKIFLFGGGHAHNTSISLARLGVTSSPPLVGGEDVTES